VQAPQRHHTEQFGNASKPTSRFGRLPRKLPLHVIFRAWLKPARPEGKAGRNSEPFSISAPFQREPRFSGEANCATQTGLRFRSNTEIRCRPKFRPFRNGTGTFAEPTVMSFRVASGRVSGTRIRTRCHFQQLCTATNRGEWAESRVDARDQITQIRSCQMQLVQ